MIPVPMLALAVSPEDKQIRKIVTLDYPTGQNSVAIITSPGNCSFRVTIITENAAQTEQQLFTITLPRSQISME